MSGRFCDAEWDGEPSLNPPFVVIDHGETASVVDGEVRNMTFAFRAKGFVNELCAVLNENSERLAVAWEGDM